MSRFYSEQPDLEQALGVVRRVDRDLTGGARLSSSTRSRILTEVSRQAAPQSIGRGPFAPRVRVWFAGALPVLLAGALLGVVQHPAVEVPAIPLLARSTVTASKVGDRIEFKIANGHRNHYVYRSTAPDGFRDGVQVTDGSYAERLNDGSSIVFYRID